MLPLIPLALSIAPEIAKWLFGDDAAKVTTQVSDVVQAVAGTVDPDIVATRLAADPAMGNDLRVKLAQIAAEREKAQRDADQAALAAQLADVASARQQTVALAQAHSPIAWGAVAMTAAVMLICGVMVTLLLMRAYPPDSKDILLLLVGQVLGWGTAAVTYWLGSSAGSASKDAQLSKLRDAASGT